MAGRPRKPTALHVLHGTRTRVDRSGEPSDIGDLGGPPAHLTYEAAAAWREIAASLAPGVASRADRFVVEIVAVLIARLRTPEGLKPADLACLHRGLASLGMTPTARSKVAPPVREKKPTADPWDTLN